MEERTRGLFSIISPEDEILTYQSLDDILKNKRKILEKPELDRTKHEINDVRDYMSYKMEFCISAKTKSFCLWFQCGYVKVLLFDFMSFRVILE